jgi:DUF4097 and DUF4098 domain-containing protein YvlB
MWSPLLLAAVLTTQNPASAQDTAQKPAPASETAQTRPIGTRTQTDQTVPVQKGSRLELGDCTGDVIVKTWDRSEVRVRASHSSRTRVSIRPREQAIFLSAEGSSVGVDFDLTVPAWINLRVTGSYCAIDIEGLTGNVDAETVEGDIALRGVSGTITAESIEGKITVEGGRGRLQLNTAEGQILVSKTSGEIVAESIDGDIVLTDVQSQGIEVSSVDGNITFSGAVQASGRYLFSTHDGDVLLMLPESTNATFGIRTYQRQKLDSTLPLKAATAAQGGRRAVYTLGSGSAQIEVESFDGTLMIRKPGEVVKRERD